MIKQSAFQILLPRLIRGTADSVIVGLFFFIGSFGTERKAFTTHV